MAEALVTAYSEKEKQDSKDSKHDKADTRVHSVFSSHVALKQYGEENSWFIELMIGVIRNKLLGSSGTVNSKLLTLSKKEGRTIGNSLASILMSSTSSDLAVEEWILTFPATQELDKNLIWFRPMMNRIAMRLLAKVAWGAKFRLYTGAALSIMDMVTDVFTIIRFFEEGKSGFALASLAFIGASIFIQFVCVFAQNKKRGAKVLLYEMLIVVCMIKPAIDAMRVANDGDVQAENVPFQAQTELTATKCTEMFAESIPSSVLQMYALLGSDTVSVSAVGSIVCSAMAISFASTTISVDFDTDPMKRSFAPTYYGYMPDANRMLIFLLMTLMTASHVLMKVLACSLLLRLSSMWLILYMGGDMAVYFLYKIVRGDLRYWISVSGWMSCLVSIFARVLVKVVTDFTLIVQFRGAFEL